MVKYNSKGNLPQKADYYALLNRYDADWRDTVRQGLVAIPSFNTSRIVTDVNIPQYGSIEMIYNYNAYGGGSNLSIAGGQSTTNRCYLFTRVIAGADYLAGGIGSENFTVIYDPNPLVIGQSYHIKIEWTATTVNLYKNGNVVYTGNISGGVDTNNTLDVFRAASVTSNTANSCCCVILKNGAGETLSNMPMCGNSADVQTNKIHTINGTINFTAKSDTASFYCDEYGFAVKSGVIYPKLLSGTGYAGLVGDPDKIYTPGHYPNTFTGNWHELTHAYFDKSDTDIWEDYVRESINYISEEPNYWHVSELTQDFIDTYVKAAYADKIFVGLDATDSDYAGAVMVFESGITADQLKDLNFWRKRKYFPERV